MPILKAIDKKILRDATSMRGQIVAIALVIACGIGSFLGMRTTMRSLDSARATDYARQRFGHVFAGLVRAPEHVAEDLRRIRGVERLQTRVVADVTLDVPGMVETVTGRLVSIPDDGRPEVNDYQLRSGRRPEPGQPDEALVSEAFANAHGFVPGDRIGAVMNGAWESLEIVGTAISPEYTYALAPGLPLPDDRRFGVLWMRREVLGPVFDLEGAFNDVSLRIARDASLAGILREVDATLERYGGTGAIPREDQGSAFIVANELRQLQTFGMMVPALFLFVAAFLQNVVFGRIVSGQREQIAALKALGYRDLDLGLHFAKLVAIVLGLGAVLGLAVGVWMGTGLVANYSDYFRFAALEYRLGAREVVTALTVSGLAAGIGTVGAIRRTIRIPPAEAMRPEAPPRYRPTFLERAGLARFLSPATRMVAREIERKPVRTVLSTAGIALATGLIVMVLFFYDAVAFVMNVQFGLSQREDVRLALVEPRSTDALASVEELPGVLRAEPFRTVPVRLSTRNGYRNAAITGVPRDASMLRVLDTRLETVEIPEEGLVLSAKLAEVLGVKAGDPVRIRIREGERRETTARVARLAETYIGISAYMNHRALCRLLGETETMNGAWLAVDDSLEAELHAAVKRTPEIAAASSRDAILSSYRDLVNENIGTSAGVSLGLSLVMALGVLYNAARITLAERARELASLRVLGFRRREVSAILLGEIASLSAIGIPLGLALGRGLAGVLVASPGFSSEQFRLPLVIAPATYAIAATTTILATAFACASAWHKLDGIDIIEVLKTRE